MGENIKMSHLKTDLVKRTVASIIADRIDDIEIDLTEIADTVATEMIREIQLILMDGTDDFEMIEDILVLFEKRGINTGLCHDDC